MPEIKHVFNQGKMNKDLDERLVPNGEYRDAMNIQVSTSDGSDIGAVQITANSCELYATTSSRTAGTATHINTNGDTTFWKADSEL